MMMMLIERTTRRLDGHHEHLYHGKTRDKTRHGIYKQDPNLNHSLICLKSI